MQALQLGQDANPPYGVFNGQRCQMCLKTDSLHKVMERLANPGEFFIFEKLLSFSIFSKLPASPHSEIALYWVLFLSFRLNLHHLRC